jgi:hypothetical protein
MFLLVFTSKIFNSSKLGLKGAIETAKLSLANATKSKNDDYVKMNSDSIAEWVKNKLFINIKKRLKILAFFLLNNLFYFNGGKYKIVNG